MTAPMPLTLAPTDLDAIAGHEGAVAVFIPGDGRLDSGARRVNRLTRGALARFVESAAFAKLEPGEAKALAWPTGLAAETLIVVRLERRRDALPARRAGAAIARLGAGKDILALAGTQNAPEEIALGALLRAYDYRDHKTGEAGAAQGGSLSLAENTAREVDTDAIRALAEGVFFTRDLVNAPANDLTTESFAARLQELTELGVEVEVLDEDRLAELGMGALLGVGQGSRSPSKVVVMRWLKGALSAEPLALVGKGVVFDTGGISIKPAAGMEDMTMDMGGAGTVAGVMKTLALRGARANVVGLVGLVENMPDGLAQRPGDIVTSMKGDTIEVINTDAEGRLVLADVMWYAQQTFKPAAMIDLATLTGAIIIGLGHENAGVFSNDDPLCQAFLKAAGSEGEGAWRMPLGAAYDKLLKSRKADMKNVGGRAAGSVTAAQFLQRFVEEGTPWIHLDIAGVADVKSDTALAPKGATGWGVLALNRLVADRYEGS